MNLANSAPATTCRRSGNILPSIAAVMRAARGLWPNKTDLELSMRTGRSERTCRYWLGRQTGLSAADLAKLLQSEDGIVFLEAAMGEARPIWWRAFRRQCEIAQINRQLEQSKRRLADLQLQLGE